MTSPQATQSEPVGGLFGRLSSSDSFFDTIKSTPESIKDYLEKCIKCLRIGKGTPPEIESAAFIAGQQMLADNLTFAELRMRYHIYPDKLALRSEYIHALIEQQGWKFEWKADGEDGKKAIFAATKNGVTKTVEFSIELAKQKGLFKGDSGWQKDPAQMLRARCITRFATMYIPSIGAGTVEDTEHGESTELDSSQVSASSVSPPLAVPATTKQVETPQPKPATATPPAATSATSEAAKSVTLQSMASVLDLPSRAFTSFNFVTDECPKITTVGDICKFTYDELLSRDKLGKGTLDKIVVELKNHGFDLKSPSSAANESGSGPVADAESATPEASTDADALDARGLELAEDSDAEHTDNEHGAAIAEIREICTDAKMHQTAKAVMGERCGGKDNLNDLSHLETKIVLVYLMAIQCGIPVDKIDAVCDKISSDSDPIGRASVNIADLRKRLGN